MPKLVLNMEKYEFCDEKGTTIFKAPILEVGLFIGSIQAGLGGELSLQEKFSAIGEALSKQFSIDPVLPWFAAMQLTRQVEDEIDSLKNGTFLDGTFFSGVRGDADLAIGLDKIARIAFNYKLSPFELDPSQFLALHFSLPKMQVEDEIHVRNAGSLLTPDRIFYLTYVQTGDIDQAFLKKSERWLETSRAEAMKDLHQTP